MDFHGALFEYFRPQFIKETHQLIRLHFLNVGLIPFFKLWLD